MKFVQQLRLNDLNKHRSVWMGVAMLWIIFFHASLNITFLPLDIFKNIGYGGVDIFLFASGLGCYYSYSKNRQPLAFLKRRILRLLPIYLPFMIVWLGYQYFYKSMPLQAVIGNLFAIQGFTGLGNDFNWYITGLAVFYILTPFLFELIEKFQKHSQMILFTGILLLLTIPFWNSYNGIIIITRLPIFTIGMYFAKTANRDSPPA